MKKLSTISIILILIIIFVFAQSHDAGQKGTLRHRLEEVEQRLDEFAERLAYLEGKIFPEHKLKEQGKVKRIQLPLKERAKSDRVNQQIARKPPNKLLDFKVITSKTYGDDMLGIQVKIINVSKRHINSCYATCILKDVNGDDLAFEQHYVIKSLEGGLAPKEFTFFEYVINVDPSRVKKVSFHIESIY